MSQPQKEMYQTPVLSMLGDIRNVTRTTGMDSATPDGAAKGMTKTDPSMG